MGSTPAARTISFCHNSCVKQRVLVLEDDAVFASMLKEGLETVSYAVTTVGTGTEGLKLVMANDYDAIVCDMVMPSLSGDMFYLAAEKVKPHLCRRFIFITGHKGDKKWVEFARQRGCVILFKPFDLHVLFEAVQVTIEKTGRIA